jgi:hypothetical protein
MTTRRIVLYSLGLLPMTLETPVTGSTDDNDQDNLSGLWRRRALDE